MLAELGRRYGLAREAGDAAALLAIGRELYGWLDGEDRWLAELRARSGLPRPFVLEIRAPTEPSGAAWAVLHAPWEVLADPAGEGFLAANDELRYAPLRRLGAPAAEPATLDEYRLGVAFMAAAPRGGGPELDFEAEEAAIMAAAAGDLDLYVEESGDPEELGRRLARLRPALPVLHLSCHGHNAWPGVDGRGPAQPVLMLEHATGAERPTTAGELVEALGGYRPRLLFLSACLTAAGEQGKAAAAAEVLSDGLAGRLVRSGLPAVLGWDGSVADVAATAFARDLYDELGKGVDIPLAAAAARRALLNGTAGAAGGGTWGKDALGGAQLRARLQSEVEVLRRDWHLARVWVGAEGGGPVAEGVLARSLQEPGGGHKRLLAARGAARLEVADPTMFVGRRRELQRALRALDGRDKSGVLLHGMGRLGKSSLAGRLIDRRADLTPVVIYADYSALGMVEALARALEAHEAAARLIAERRPAVREGGAAALRALLVALLVGPCAGTQAGDRPLLLLVDDLERMLEADQGGGRHRVKAALAEERGVLAALLGAFAPQRSLSRLVLTSRFAFTLMEGGQDLVGRLAEIELSEFGETARRKLALRQIKAAQVPEPAAEGDEERSDPLDPAELEARLPLLARVQVLARGNPGLQDLLGADVVLRPAVPVATAAAVLDEVEAYLGAGDLPRSEVVRDFLEELAVDALLKLAGSTGRDLLRAATLFQVPVPEAVIAALAKEIGGQPRRLRDLGMLVPAEDLVQHGRPALAVNGLTGGRLTALDEAEQRVLAPLALPVLFAAWGGAAGSLGRPYAADRALTRLGLLAGDAVVVEACAAAAVRGLVATGQPGAAGELGEAAVALLEQAHRKPPLRLLSRTAEAWQTAGDGARAKAALAKAGQAGGEDLDQLSNYLFTRGNHERAAGQLDVAEQTFEQLCDVERRRDNPHQLAVARGRIAEILQARGELDEALRIYREDLLPVFDRLGDVRSRALTMGQIADIVEARGELDEALRVRREEQLPVFDRLGDVRERAVTMGQIADILEARGELDEALRIRREDLLPVFDRLGDVRSRAITMGKIADILQARGELDEALRIRREEELAVYDRLGDVRSRAVTMGQIAEILQTRGQLDEALRILREDLLPVFDRLGDVRSCAVTMGKIADILEARGELDEALRIRREEELPVYDRLGDVRERAVTMGKIANILEARGELDEALRIRREDLLPVFDRLGDVRGRAITMGQIADILQARGELDEALRIRREDLLPVFDRLGDVRSRAVTMGKIADILQARGELDEALRIRREEELPVYDRLGDVRERAFTMGKIANILEARGELDEALRIRREDLLPVFDRLGDVRSRAVAMGQIADILQKRGELDEALRIRREEELPVYDRLGDVRERAVTLQKIAAGLIKAGGLERSRVREIYEALQQAFDISVQLKLPDGVAFVGMQLAQVLSFGGRRDEALAVLDQAEAAFRQLQHEGGVEQVNHLRKTIGGPRNDGMGR